ncbi:MAG: MATE family efflux transporter [Eubacteriales bacterium]|nr:MATE family efflux transporter [Eubacteriales bacterium]
MENQIKSFFNMERLVPEKHRVGALPDGREASRTVVNLAVPSIIEMVMMSLIGGIDTIMVGRLGATALAAVALPMQPRMIMMSLFFALNVGITAIVARRKGEGRRDEANLTLRNAIMIVFALSLVVMALGIIFAEPLMRLAGGNTRTPEDAEVLSLSVTYFDFITYSLPIGAVSMCINAALRGVGNTKITMQVNIISNLVNVVFNYLLIGGNLGFPRLGVAGAAIASSIGILAGAIISFVVVMKGSNTYLHLSRKDSWRVDIKTMKGILKIGGNAMIEQLSMRFGFFLYSRILYGLGVVMFAAHNIGMQFLGVTFNFANGTAVAGTSLTGQNLGAKRPDLAMMYGKLTLRLALMISVVVGAIIVLFRYPFANMFIESNAQHADIVIQNAAETLLVIALMQPFQMSSVVIAGCLRGAGDNLYVAAVMAVAVSVIRPIMGYLAVYVFSFDLALTWIFGLSEMVLRMVLFLRRFQSGKWMTIKV